MQCHYSEGDVVLKLLNHEDPSLLLGQYKQELLAFAKLTNTNVSIASFRIVEIRQNFAFIARQFVRFSLYDRLSTRPFLTHLEKCWIVFQVFKCMAWCHEKGIQHGDIKLENTLVTSSLWVVLADFATYKPVCLPEVCLYFIHCCNDKLNCFLLLQDNPAFFNYFFDTSRRRSCNIAPERFVSSNFTQIENLSFSSGVFQSQSQDAQLTNKMDMFSIGCTLAEIFSDNVLFDLSGLLSYKNHKFEQFEHVLKQIPNQIIRDLVENLTHLDPSSRKVCRADSSVQSQINFCLFIQHSHATRCYLN